VSENVEQDKEIRSTKISRAKFVKFMLHVVFVSCKGSLLHIKFIQYILNLTIIFFSQGLNNFNQ